MERRNQSQCRQLLLFLISLTKVWCYTSKVIYGGVRVAYPGWHFFWSRAMCLIIFNSYISKQMAVVSMHKLFCVLKKVKLLLTRAMGDVDFVSFPSPNIWCHLLPVNACVSPPDRMEIEETFS